MHPYDRTDRLRVPVAARCGHAATFPLGAALVAAALCAPAGAIYDPAQNYVEAPAVAARFPDPPTPAPTPALRAGRANFTGQAEMMKFLTDLAARAPDMRMNDAGRSQEDRTIPLLIFAHPPAASGAELAANGKPTVLVIGQQYGNEPAGGEAALALALELTGERQRLLDRVNVLIVPRANPDGAQHFTRATPNGFDLNRDHLLQWTPEGKALGRIFAAYQPAVVIDSHEFGVRSRWLEKFGAGQRYDVLVQYATVPNLSPAIAEASERIFREALARALDAAGFLEFLVLHRVARHERPQGVDGRRRAGHRAQRRRIAQRDQLPHRVARGWARARAPAATGPRPYGYLLPASQAAAADRLRNLGVAVARVDTEGEVDVERFRITRATVAKKDDVRSDPNDKSIRVVDLETLIERVMLPVHAGDLFVPLDQPLANVVVAALEPGTQSSYAANYALTFPGPRDPDRYVRVSGVMSPLRATTTPWSGL